MINTIPPVLSIYMEGLKAHDVDGIGETVSDDLDFVTPAKTLTKDQFLQMLRALYAAFPDWHYENDPPELQDGAVAVNGGRGERTAAHSPCRTSSLCPRQASECRSLNNISSTPFVAARS